MGNKMFFEDLFNGKIPNSHSSRPQTNVDNKKFYKLLGVDKKVDAKNLKKAWRKICRIHHPDRGGDLEKFKQCEQAYEVLSDPAKRELYDEGGVEAVQRGGTSPTDIFDLFTNQGRKQEKKVFKPHPIKKMLSLTLEDVFKGPTKKITISLLTAKEKKVCQRCSGRGMYMETVQRGPMIMQSQKECSSCGGRGTSFIGEKTKKKKIEIFVPQGVKDGDKHVLEGQGHSLPDMPLGDVIIIYSIKSHKRYTRIQADLALQKEITLKEAICGYSFFIRHINGTDWIRIHSRAGQIVQPNSVVR